MHAGWSTPKRGLRPAPIVKINQRRSDPLNPLRMRWPDERGAFQVGWWMGEKGTTSDLSKECAGSC